jgi:hypothetical protein
LFFNVNAKTALPCFIAASRSALEEARAAFISSKALEAGKASVKMSVGVKARQCDQDDFTILENHFVVLLCTIGGLIA